MRNLLIIPIVILSYFLTKIIKSFLSGLLVGTGAFGFFAGIAILLLTPIVFILIAFGLYKISTKYI